jgi:hypothetical protein
MSTCLSSDKLSNNRQIPMNVPISSVLNAVFLRSSAQLPARKLSHFSLSLRQEPGRHLDATQHHTDGVAK